MNYRRGTPALIDPVPDDLSEEDDLDEIPEAEMP